MDGEWQQQNGNVQEELDLTIPSDDKDSFWNNLANVDDDDDDDAEDPKDEDYTGASSSRKKRRARKHPKRHRTEQTQQLEAVFRECQHPDENMRLDLADKLNMGILQVKFWFQNRRSAKKGQLEREENKMLKDENEALKAEHKATRTALLKKICPECGGPMVPREDTPERQRLLLENARLKDQLYHATAAMNAASGKAPMPVPGGYSQLAADLSINGTGSGSGSASVMNPAVPPLPRHAPMVQGCDCVAIAKEQSRTALFERVLRARDEFMTMVKKDGTLWLPTLDGEVLDYARYRDVSFPDILELCPQGFAANGTRDAGMVMGTGPDLFSMLTDASRWCEAFHGIVASVTTERVVPPSAHYGVVQLMNVNLMVLSPRTPICKVQIVRQSQLIKPNVWAVVDVSVQGIYELQNNANDATNTWMNAAVPMACRMLPSGCLIEDMNNGYCKVTCIVNAEYDRTVVSTVYHPLFRSGHALGARRWLTALQRRCQYLALLRSDPVPYVVKTSSAIPPKGRVSILNTAKQMTASFYATICGAGHRGKPWSSIEEWRGSGGVGNESFEVAVRVVTVCTGGAQAGLVVSAATTVWLPGIPAKHVFDYVSDGDRRAEWDTFSNGAPLEQEDYVAAVQFPHYAVSVLRPKAYEGTIHKKLMLQQACTDPSCMLLAYAPAEEHDLQEVMRGGSHTAFTLLPSGFIILPDGHGDNQIPAVDTKCPSGSGAMTHRNNDGCFVSVLCQRFLGGPTPSEKLTKHIINNVGGLVSRSVEKIKEAVHANVVVTVTA